MAGPFDAVYPDTYNTIQDILKRQRDLKRQAMLDQLHSKQVEAQIDTERENAETNREYRKGLIEDRAAARATQADAKKDADYKAKTGNFTMGDTIPQSLLPDARQRGDVTQKPAFNDMMQVNGENMFPYAIGMPDAGNFTKGGEGSGAAPAPPPSLMAPDKEVWSGSRQEKEDAATAKRVRDFVLSMGGKQKDPFAQLALGGIDADPKHAAQILDTFLSHAMSNSKPTELFPLRKFDQSSGALSTIMDPDNPGKPIMTPNRNPLNWTRPPREPAPQVDRVSWTTPDGQTHIGEVNRKTNSVTEIPLPTGARFNNPPPPGGGAGKLSWLNPATEARYVMAFKNARAFKPTDMSDQAVSARTDANAFRSMLIGEAKARKVAPDHVLDMAEGLAQKHGDLPFEQAVTFLKTPDGKPLILSPAEQSQLHTYFSIFSGK